MKKMRFTPGKGRRSIHYLRMRLSRWQELDRRLDTHVKATCADDSIKLTARDWLKWERKRREYRKMIGKLKVQLAGALRGQERYLEIQRQRRAETNHMYREREKNAVRKDV